MQPTARTVQRVHGATQSMHRATPCTVHAVHRSSVQRSSSVRARFSCHRATSADDAQAVAQRPCSAQRRQRPSDAPPPCCAALSAVRAGTDGRGTRRTSLTGARVVHEARSIAVAEHNRQRTASGHATYDTCHALRPARAARGTSARAKGRGRAAGCTAVRPCCNGSRRAHSRFRLRVHILRQDLPPSHRNAQRT